MAGSLYSTFETMPSQDPLAPWRYSMCGRTQVYTAKSLYSVVKVVSLLVVNHQQRLEWLLNGDVLCLAKLFVISQFAWFVLHSVPGTF